MGDIFLDITVEALGVGKTEEGEKIRDSRYRLENSYIRRAVTQEQRNKLQEIRSQKNSVALKPGAKKVSKEGQLALDVAEILRKTKMNSLHNGCPMFENTQLTSITAHHFLLCAKITLRCVVLSC